MDPTIKQIVREDSFNEIKSSGYPLVFDGSMVYSGSIIPDFNIRYLQVNEQPVLEFCDPNKFYQLNQLKNRFDHPAFKEARDETNPFEKIPKSIFKNRASTKFANIDYVFKILGKKWNTVNMTSPDKFTFLDVAAGPGSFTQQIQFRYPNARGIGMTLIGPLDWDKSILDLTRFETFYGPDQTGDILKQWKDLLRHLMNNYPDLDFVSGDGAFEIDDPERISAQELVNSELFLKQVVNIIAIRDGGSCVFKLFDANTKFTADLLYLMSLLFEQISLFKPCTSRPANAERYIVGLRKRGNDNLHRILYQVTSAYSGGNQLKSFFEDLPDDFKRYLTKINNFDLDSQTYYANRIIMKLEKKDALIRPIDVNVYKPISLFALPDTPFKFKSGQLWNSNQSKFVFD